MRKVGGKFHLERGTISRKTAWHGLSRLLTELGCQMEQQFHNFGSQIHEVDIKL